MDELEKLSKNSDSYDAQQIDQTVSALETGSVTSSDKVSALSCELKRLRIILNECDPEYLSRLEMAFNEACKLTANAQQIMQLRNLVLQKERKVSFEYIVKGVSI